MTFSGNQVILCNVIEAWLSLVERCVRDAEVASSNLVASILYKHIWPVGQAVKTTASHAVNPGSIPGQVTYRVLWKSFQSIFCKAASVAQSVEQRIRNAWVGGSSPPGSFFVFLRETLENAGKNQCFQGFSSFYEYRIRTITA